jgi:hypothetical protein
VDFFAATAQVRLWHGPELPSGALYDCYRVSSGLKPGEPFGPEVTHLGPKALLFAVMHAAELMSKTCYT